MFLKKMKKNTLFLWNFEIKCVYKIKIQENMLNSLLLKDSDFKGDVKYEDVIALANNGLGNDKNGYLREFVRLVDAVNRMTK